MKAGFAQIDYTPKGGFMPGQFEAQFAEGAHMPLTASAMALSDGKEEIILISADHLMFSNPYADGIRTRISEACGVPMDHILLAATHTHTGPGLAEPCWKCPAEPLVANIVAKRIATVAVEAYRDMRDGAAIGSGLTEERRFSFCRDWVLTDGTIVTNPGYNRTDLDHTCAAPDYRVNVLRVERDGKLAAIVVNYANHPDTTFTHMHLKFHPDYPGCLRAALKEKYGEEVKVLFFNGTCGDINDRDFKNKSDINGGHRDPAVIPPEVIGRGLADTVSKLLDTLVADRTEGVIKASSSKITVKRRQITEDEVAWAKDTLKQAEEEYLPIPRTETARVFLETCENVPETELFEIAVMRIGDVALVGLPGEIYTKVGLAIKAGSPFGETLVAELANGCHGYVIPDNVRNNGSYEGRFSSGTTGYGTEDAIVKGALGMLRQI